MFDLWLKTGQRIVDEVIEESNLKEIFQSKMDGFMQSEEFQQWCDKLLKDEIKRCIEEYSEYYLIDENKLEDIIIKCRKI